VQGWIGEWKGQLDLAFWHARPTNPLCTIDDCSAAGNATTDMSDCRCESGVFVGWGSQWVVYACMVVSIVYSHFTGVVVRQFSSIMRAIADGGSLVCIYFILTPLLDQTGFPPGNLANDCMILIIPLSGATFSFAAAEMRKVVRAADFGGVHYDSSEEDDSSVEDWTSESGSDSDCSPKR